MSKEKPDHKKDNLSYLEVNPRGEREKALEVLAKAKEQEAAKLAAGKKWYKVDNRTEILK
tara:strand:+ start:2008 stop:2187 length:180 start_codon:yes stop_codon:yes gene_type:complete